MSTVKKAVFFGPAGSGKTTLRRIFFEGQSAKKLLDISIEPTYGVESEIVSFGEDWGIFDLAGQELDRWMDMERDIFRDTDVVIYVTDITLNLRKSLEYISRFMRFKSRTAPDAAVYILFHKIDLVKPAELERIKKRVRKHLRKYRDIRVAFTSIKKEFFTGCLSVFLEIFSILNNKMDIETLRKITFIRENLALFSCLYSERVMSVGEIISVLGIKSNRLKKMLKIYSDGGFLRIKKLGNVKAVFLTDVGMQFYKMFIRSFLGDIDTGTGTDGIILPDGSDISFENGIELKKGVVPGRIYSGLMHLKNCAGIYKEMGELKPDDPEFIAKILPKLFFGLIIFDENGKTLLVYEPTPGYLMDIIDPDKEGIHKEYNMDIELIPMFFNALEKFSKEINISTLLEFSFRGDSLQIEAISKGPLTMAVFGDPRFDINTVLSDFGELLEEFIENHKREVNAFIKYGNSTPFESCIDEIAEGVKKIMEKYIRILKEKCETLSALYPESAAEEMITLEEKYEKYLDGTVELLTGLNFDNTENLDIDRITPIGGIYEPSSGKRNDDVLRLSLIYMLSNMDFGTLDKIVNKDGKKNGRKRMR